MAENPETYGVTFTKYIKLVLPLDGFVFWVRADLVSESALLNAGKMNSFLTNQPEVQVTAAKTVQVKGSLHYATDSLQQEDESYGKNRVIFTAEKEVQDFNQVGPDVVFIGEWEGLKFAFSVRQNFYQQAGIYHYIGDAVYPDMETQLIDSIDGFDPSAQIVSNSLPFWLQMNGFNGAAIEEMYPWYPFGNPLPLYPSYLLPSNILPPFGSVHVEETEALASTPFLGKTYQHYQLAKDKVRITMYGLGNSLSLNFVDFVNQYSLDFEHIGILNMPILKDEKRTQSELGTISQKKTIEYEVSYHQSQARDIARQLITQAIPTFIIND